MTARAAAGGPVFRFASSACTDTGPVRAVNEDACLVRDALGPGVGLWAVADGMGGHQAGDVASQLVVQALSALGLPQGGHDFLVAAERALKDASTAMIEQARALGPSAVVGSTAVVVLAFGGHYACLWVGDSRAYLLREGRLARLTRDDSLVQSLLDGGMITEAEARGHQHANVLTRALGAEPDLSLNLAEGPMRAGDVYLLCSDGLSNALTEMDIMLALSRASATGQDLVRQALAQGATDNVTAVIVRCA